MVQIPHESGWFDGHAGLSQDLTQNCTMGSAGAAFPHDLTFLQQVKSCQIDVEREDLPIPVWPLSSFASVKAALQRSFEAFLEVQRQLGDDVDALQA